MRCLSGRKSTVLSSSSGDWVSASSVLISLGVRGQILFGLHPLPRLLSQAVRPEILAGATAQHYDAAMSGDLIHCIDYRRARLLGESVTSAVSEAARARV